MPVTVLYSENAYGDESVERDIFGPGVRVILPGPTDSLADLPDEVCREADGLMILRFRMSAAGRPYTTAVGSSIRSKTQRTTRGSCN